MQKFAKAVRIITLPTLMFFSMYLILFFIRRDLFIDWKEFLVPLIGIGVLPLLSYPISYIVPKEKREGRNVQRRLAFIFSFVGYTTAFILSLVFSLSKDVLLIVSTYFGTVVILSILNLCKIKASGHASGTLGPMLLLCHFVGYIYLIPCLLLFGLSSWASIYLKRHTPKEFIFGTLTCGLAFFLSYLFIFII